MSFLAKGTYHLQGSTKGRALGCEKYLPCPAWVVLATQVHLLVELCTYDFKYLLVLAPLEAKQANSHDVVEHFPEAMKIYRLLSVSLSGPSLPQQAH